MRMALWQRYLHLFAILWVIEQQTGAIGERGKVMEFTKHSIFIWLEVTSPRSCRIIAIRCLYKEMFFEVVAYNLYLIATR